MYPEIHIGNFTIYSYRLMWILAVISVPLVIVLKRKTYSLSLKKTMILCISAIVSGYIGCNVLYALENIDEIITIGWSFFTVSFFGCVMITPLIMYLMSVLFDIEKGKTFDLLAFGLPCFLSLIRIGCFLGGCCGGSIYNHKTYMWIKIPTQLIEIGLLIPIIIEFSIFEKKNLFKGYRFPMFLFEYGIIRFSIEFLRETNKDFLRMSLGQIYSIIIFIVGLTIFLISLNKIKESNLNELRLSIEKTNKEIEDNERKRVESLKNKKIQEKKSKNPYKYSRKH